MEQNYNFDPNIAYDVVELPSKGIYYANKKTSIRVAYLTATDENILTAPNLIAQGRVIDELLKRKLVDKDIRADELVEEDRQAILLFLRNTAFGGEYKLNLKDPKTDEKFSVNIDLSTVRIKDLEIQADANGEFEYFMKKAKKKVTFKFLNKFQEEELEKLGKEWSDEQRIAPVITKRLEMLIKSVDGNTDMMAIHRFVETLPFTDSKDFQKFVKKNKPGLDLTIDVKTPSGETIQAEIGFGVEFFRPFYGI